MGLLKKLGTAALITQALPFWDQLLSLQLLVAMIAISSQL